MPGSLNKVPILESIRRETMSNAFELNAELRDQSGKAAARRIRRTDRIPAIVYGADEEPTPVSLLHKDVLHAFKNEAVFSHILTLNVGSKPEKVVLKGVQRHPNKRKVLHVDFLRIRANEAIIMHIPLHYIGEETAIGIKAGGVISKLITDIEVKCLPANLPEFVEVDISKLELGSALHLSEIKLPKGVALAMGEISEANDQPIISIHMPKVTEESEAVLEAASGVHVEEPAAESESAAKEGEAATSGEEQPKE